MTRSAAQASPSESMRDLASRAGRLWQRSTLCAGRLARRHGDVLAGPRRDFVGGHAGRGESRWTVPSSEDSGSSETRASGDVVEFGRENGRGPRWRRPGVLLLGCLVAAAIAVVGWPGSHRSPAPPPVPAPGSQFPGSSTPLRALDSPWCGRRIAQGCSFLIPKSATGGVVVVHVSIAQVPGP